MPPFVKPVLNFVEGGAAHSAGGFLSYCANLVWFDLESTFDRPQMLSPVLLNVPGPIPHPSIFDRHLRD